ncbi:MAG TPA: Ig-like domain-containing protein [Vicinamibacterales bacterium]|nr:Ig-like domain-containing protein [Vicinamibacterales bacterium]
MGITTKGRRTRRGLWAVALFGIFAPSWSSPALAQSSGRHLTTIDALRRFPGYFHLQNVVLRGEFVENGRRVSLRAGDSEMQVMLTDVSTVSGPVEVRAQLYDVGRLTASDPRLGRYENKPDQDHWPQPGEELLLNITSVATAGPESTPTLRLIALEPWKFDGQSVSVTGQFGGRNLFGDVPAAPAKDKYDFVLRNTEGAVWVTGLRPKGKGFDLNVDARVDTSHWLQVSGVVKRERGLVLLEAKTIVPSQAPATRVVVEQAPPPPKEPGEIVFSSPTDGETNVSSTAPIRVQFSRGIDPPTLNGHFRFSYVGGAPPEGTMEVQATYDAGSHAVVLKLSKPLEPFRTIKIELLDGVKTFDGAPIRPWSMTFSVGAT